MVDRKKLFLGSILIVLGTSVFWIFLFHAKVEIHPTSVQILSSLKLETEQKIQEISDTEHYKIRAYYPYTSYEVLNQAIAKMIQKEITDFKKIGKNQLPSPFQYYTLDIRYDSYTYQDYMSYVFYIFIDTAGAHPNTYIHTISYNRATNELVSINSLVQENDSILEILSKESIARLREDKKFQGAEYENIQDMVLEGTRPTLENFRNFAFSKDGLIVFFENYQVAPYVYGSFEVTIPYSTLGIDV